MTYAYFFFIVKSLKPGFHLIITIAAMAEKSAQRSDRYYMKTQPEQSQRTTTSYISGNILMYNISILLTI